MGERGASLSGGQRQRMSIARSLMLARGAGLRRLTAAIDAGTEERIRAAMRRGPRAVTIIISHRLSSLMHADQILFLDDGRSSSAARIWSCWRGGGRYRALYDLQIRA